MRGIPTAVNRIRRKIFAEIARIAFESEDVRGDLEAVPYSLTPSERPQFRESIYRERAIASERVRLAMGLSLNPQNQPVNPTNGLEESNISERYYEPPLMQVIPSACDKCEENSFVVSNHCRQCIARYCVESCPVDAVYVRDDGYAEIDQEKCIRCGKCKAACPYDAITHQIRPCAAACGVNAISSDELGRAYIHPEKCVGCGQCMVTCPFGAIADKSQLYQLIRALKGEDEIIAEVAPAIVGQFGENVTLGQLITALKKLGFSDVVEVAHGADSAAKAEARTYATKVATGKLPYLLTSCCPSWSMLAKREISDKVELVSSELTPMVATAQKIKEKSPKAHVVFIGPCAAKKLEALRKDVRSEVEFVITFEELAAIFEARGIDPATCTEEVWNGATAAGRGYGAAGGVADAIERCVREYYPDTEVKIEHAEGLFDCRKMLTLAKHGKKNGCLIEGMGCPGGCAGGAGVNIPVAKGVRAVQKFAADTQKKLPDAQSESENKN
ncbi:MAG: monomeric [Clostridia bacterium]|nr:monomeric [FeFe] hydrogenase [Clostridia bacterium]